MVFTFGLSGFVGGQPDLWIENPELPFWKSPLAIKCEGLLSNQQPCESI